MNPAGILAPMQIPGISTVVIVGGLVTLASILLNGLRGPKAKDPTTLPGLATRSQIKALCGPKALLAQAPHLRPSLTNPTTVDLGHMIGRAKGVPVWVGLRDSMIAVGGPGSGKGTCFVIPAILDAPGAVVTTSTRPDNAEVVWEACTARGPVALFDPQGLAKGLPSATKWSPTRGCETPRVAMARGRALTSGSGDGIEDSSHWSKAGAVGVQCILHAAALQGLGAATVYRWSLSPIHARDAIDILANHPDAAPGWDVALEAILDADDRYRDSVWAIVGLAFSALALPEVMAAVTPAPGEGFDPAAFLTTRGTLFLLATSGDAGATANLSSALIEDVVQTARLVASQSANSRLANPLSLILDEAAHYPLPSLESLLSEGGGSGIQTMVAYQSLAQLRTAKGRDFASAIWGAATVKLVLPRVADADDLADWSKLCGLRDEQQVTKSSGAQGRGGRSTSTREVPVMPAAIIGQMPIGRALLLVGSCPPIVLESQTWMGRKDGAALEAAKQRTHASRASREPVSVS